MNGEIRLNANLLLKLNSIVNALINLNLIIL